MRYPSPALLLASLLFFACESLLSAKEISLHDGWKLQSACKVADSGKAISSPGYRTSDWISASVPTTVLAAQVAAGIYKDIYYGTNLRSISGATYPIGENFSNLPMPADSPYHCAWWYRTDFSLPTSPPQSRFRLQFEGINYSAEIWVNGKRIADQSEVRGAYRTYEFDITPEVNLATPVVVAVEVFPPTEKSLAMNWVDWSPMPPDKEMGLWADVRLLAGSPVTLRNPAVFTHFENDNLQTALLTATADISNSSTAAIEGEVVAEIAGRRVSQSVRIPERETVTVNFRPDTFSQLKMSHPRMWWPLDYGDHPEYSATFRLVANGKIMDEQQIQFGVREITSELTAAGHRLFRINGKPILIRGGGWSPDMLLRSSQQRQRDQFAMVRDLHLNTIRLEGKIESDEFFRLADRYGILVLAGWCCCDYWEKWSEWSTEDLQIAGESLKSQMLRLRSHPSVLAWMYGSDNPPPAEVERHYSEIIASTQWPNPVVSSASATPTSSTGASGVKMTGPYDYVAPSYWYQDTFRSGGAFGFNTETSPGAAPEQVAELKRFLPDSALWPPDNPVFDFHAGGEDFKNLHRFSEAMRAMYGPVDSVAAYSQIGQTMAYDSERAMFEAYSGNRYNSTGIIQWMLNNAWPSLLWHLYDYYLVPGGGYYGAKKASEPVHIQYDYAKRGVVVVNSTLSDTYDMESIVEVLGPDLKPLFTKSLTLDVVPANSSQVAITLPDSIWSHGAPFYFVRLSLGKGDGVNVSRNFYWVPASLTVFDWSKSTYINTPAKQSENLTALRDLPRASIEATVDIRGNAVLVRIANPSKVLAFQLAIEAYDEAGQLIPMMLWNDNYIQLMPGETTVISAAIPRSYPSDKISIRVSGWNLTPWQHTIAVSRKAAAR
jgi:exo-1,4-beta-D-glucosaminidase